MVILTASIPNVAALQTFASMTCSRPSEVPRRRGYLGAEGERKRGRKPSFAVDEVLNQLPHFCQ
jgi:hypothetical protein